MLWYPLKMKRQILNRASLIFLSLVLIGQVKGLEPSAIVTIGPCPLGTPRVISDPEFSAGDLPIWSNECRLEAFSILLELYPSDFNGAETIISDPNPLIDYLYNLRKKIKKQQIEIDALDAKIAGGEKISPDLAKIRSKMSESISFDEKLYKELKSYLNNALDGSELKPPNE